MLLILATGIVNCPMEFAATALSSAINPIVNWWVLFTRLGILLFHFTLDDMVYGPVSFNFAQAISRTRMAGLIFQLHSYCSHALPSSCSLGVCAS